MSIRSWSEAALSATLEAIGDAVQITNPATADTQSVQGQVVRVDTMVDPMSGARVYAPSTAVTVRLSSLTAVPLEGWSVATTDITGAAITGVIRDISIDHTQGMLTFNVEAETDDD